MQKATKCTENHDNLHLDMFLLSSVCIAIDIMICSIIAITVIININIDTFIIINMNLVASAITTNSNFMMN